MAQGPEKRFQNLIIKMGKAEGAHIFKCSEKYHSGIPDIYCSINFISGWIELKYDNKKHKTHTTINPPEPTKLQQKFIRDEITAGGTAGWLLGFKIERETWALVGCIPAIEPIFLMPKVLTVANIMGILYSMSQQARDFHSDALIQPIN